MISDKFQSLFDVGAKSHISHYNFSLEDKIMPRYIQFKNSVFRNVCISDSNWGRKTSREYVVGCPHKPQNCPFLQKRFTDLWRG